MAKEPKVYVSVNSLSPCDRETLRDAVKEVADSMIRIASERDLMKTAIDVVAEKLGVDKKIVRAMAKTYFKANFENVKDEHSQFEEFYELVMNNP